MVFSIVVILMLLAVGFFHYVQGFFSATISAVLSLISAAIALAYYESIVEGPLAGIWINWMPALVLLGLFALTYTILRTIFDKAIPGGTQLPAIVDKIGGAIMGLVAGAFAVGIVVVAAQQMPFGPSIAGYTRYEVSGSRQANVPTGVINARAKESNTYDEMNDVRFDPEKRTRLMVPVDDLLVGTVAHLSDGGALNRDKPLASVHPDLLTELFGLRLGIEAGANRAVGNFKGKNTVEVVGVFEAPALDDKRIIDHEIKKIRGGTVVKVPAKLLPGERRIVVRARIAVEAGDTKDKRVRLSPGAVRIVAKSDDNLSNEPAYTNYFPVGTLDPDGRLFVNKVDDYLFIDTGAQKVVGEGTGPAEVDFVFTVKEKGFFSKADPQKIEDGVFFELKKFARVDLTGDQGTLKRWTPAPVLAVRRKHIDWEPERATAGETPMEFVKGKRTGPSPTPAPGGGGGALGERLAGSWEEKALPGAKKQNFTFAADGGMTVEQDGQTRDGRWVASGPPQGETLTIKAGAANADPAASGRTMTITFLDNDSFNLTDDGGGQRRYARTGSAAAAAPAGPTAQDTMATLAGTWENAEGLRFTFRVEGTYTGAKGEQSMDGTGRDKGEIQRTLPVTGSPFKRKS